MDVKKETDRILKDGIKDQRDVAVGMELSQIYHDRLMQLENNVKVEIPEAVILVEGKAIRFNLWDQVYTFLAGVMNA